MHRLPASLRIAFGAAAVFVISMAARAGDTNPPPASATPAADATPAAGTTAAADNTTQVVDNTKKQSPKDKAKADKAAADKAAADKKKVAAEKDPDQIGNRNVAKGPNFYSIEKEIALGKSLAEQVQRQAKIIDDPVIAEYVNRVGQNLVRNSDAKVPFTIKVIDIEDVNAFALPGGFFFVNSGLILRADTEAELAGVMAHEIAHVAARHGTRQATKAELAQLMTLPLIFYGGWAGYGARQAAGVLLPLSFLHFSQGAESEADLLGLEYMYKTGYDPEAFVDFFEKIQALEKKKPGTLSKFFSTHPPTGNRIVTSQQNIQKYLKERPEYVVTTSEFDNVKARLQALHNRKKVDPKDQNNGPTLRKKPGAGTGSADDPAGSTQSDDDRPTLKRRPQDTN
jgi:beta-barrel assembly-enhancing protease